MKSLLLPTVLAASINSDYHAGVVLSGSSRNFSPSKAPLHQSVKDAVFPWTATASFADGDKVTLGSLGIPGAQIVIDECSIRGTGTGTPAVKFTLQKTDADGNNAVALSAQTSQVTSATAKTSFAIPTAGDDLITLAQDDLLKVVLNYGTGTTLTLAATNTFEVVVRYRLKDPA
jgi:hypothetical protein